MTTDTVTWGPVFGSWEPSVAFKVRHMSRMANGTPEVFNCDLKIEWEDWTDASTNVVYRKNHSFLEGENPFEHFNLQMTAPRRATDCNDALLAFYGVNVSGNLCDELEIQELEEDCGLVLCKEQIMVHRGKELTEFVLQT